MLGHQGSITRYVGSIFWGLGSLIDWHLSLISVGCQYYPWQGCWPSYFSHLFSLDIIAATQNVFTVLGFLTAISRSSTHHNQQIQHFSSIGLGWSYNRSADSKRRLGTDAHSYAVSLGVILSSCHWSVFVLLTRTGRYIVATTTIWSGASYIFSKDAIKILNKP